MIRARYFIQQEGNKFYVGREIVDDDALSTDGGDTIVAGPFDTQHEAEMRMQHIERLGN